MKIQQIDKKRYRKHLNLIIITCVISLAALSLLLSQTTIYFFTDRTGSHFWLNLAGVIAAVLIIGSILNKYKHHEFMTEVYYVWQLKQQINYIIRKTRAIEAAIENDGDENALTIMRFYYLACEQLYTLDDNTITMSSLTQKSNALLDKIDSLNLQISAENYQQALLKKF